MYLFFLLVSYTHLVGQLLVKFVYDWPTIDQGLVAGKSIGDVYKHYCANSHHCYLFIYFSEQNCCKK